MRIFKIVSMFVIIHTLAGCNTMNGAGKDIQSLGYFIEYGVADMQEHVKA